MTDAGLRMSRAHFLLQAQYFVDLEVAETEVKGRF